MNDILPLLLPVETPDTAASYLLNQTGGGHFVVTLNFELLARALSTPAFADLANLADHRICDGIGGKLLLSLSHPQARIPRIPGIDLGYALLQHASERGVSVFLLGGAEGVAQQAARNLTEQLPRLRIVGTYHGYFHKTDTPALRGMIRASGAEIVIVCLGSPLQEEWILKNRRYLPSVRLFLPLGGSLDVWANNLPRAPKLLQNLGLEWVFRIVLEPRRLRRLWKATAELSVFLAKHPKLLSPKSEILFPIQ